MSPKFMFELYELSNSEMSKILHYLKSRKCGGVNQIAAFAYSILEPLVLNLLTHIINIIIRKSHFPDI